MALCRRSPVASYFLGLTSGAALSLLAFNFFSSELMYFAKPNDVYYGSRALLTSHGRVEHVREENEELMRENTYKKAIHVNATWAPRCNKHIFFSADPKSGLPTVNLNVTEGRRHLWAKTKRAFKYLYEHELHNFDWFYKADDDTYALVENLRFMLMGHSPDAPLSFGCKFKPFVKSGYMSGGAGYVLSRESLRRFVEEALPNKTKCKGSDSAFAEDVEMGKCLRNVGVEPADSRDYQGRHRMLPLAPTVHMNANGTLPKWLMSYMFYPYRKGSQCCSNYVVSFHYINTGFMYTLDYFIYKLSLFGSHHEHFQKYGAVNSTIFERATAFARSYSQVGNS
ncbi:hypothetical protein QR680_005984 [Steinernema hermaphroditum]|uniref:Glycoprotein-N-acetylgalactosamine 3-beta-galactosyltransferase 1 n=1 Tax=Steinernema hermaphroditum TaxID=289476 RepID=A0AA39HW79_9BILA|nr:hypothetical protein QR680_005984 [Steinernema hermaphroditum]